MTRARPEFSARGRDGDRDFGGFMFHCVEPMGIVRRFFQKAIARTQGAFERGDTARMLRIDRQHEPVKEAATLGGWSIEQRVHRRRQPHHAQVIRERSR